MSKPAFVSYHCFEEKQAAPSECASSILPSQQHQWAMALVLVGLKLHSASWFWGFGLCLHSETLGLGGSLHRVLLRQSTKAFWACSPAWCSVQALLLGSWIGAGAVLEQLHHCSCVSAAAAMRASDCLSHVSPHGWAPGVSHLCWCHHELLSFWTSTFHWPWHSSQAAPLRDDKSPI